MNDKFQIGDSMNLESEIQYFWGSYLKNLTTSFDRIETKNRLALLKAMRINLSKLISYLEWRLR